LCAGIAAHKKVLVAVNRPGTDGQPQHEKRNLDAARKGNFGLRDLAPLEQVRETALEPHLGPQAAPLSTERRAGRRRS